MDSPRCLVKQAIAAAAAAKQQQQLQPGGSSKSRTSTPEAGMSLAACRASKPACYRPRSFHQHSTVDSSPLPECSSCSRPASMRGKQRGESILEPLLARGC
jgi:hypothetical protein